MVERYVLQYIPQYDSVEADLVHASLFLVIRRGILVEILKRGREGANQYFEQSIVKLNVETALNSPFVNKDNFTGNLKVISDIVRKGKPLGHHAETKALVSCILDYMQMNFYTETNSGYDTRIKFYHFFRRVGDKHVRCMSCQHLSSRSTFSVTTIKRHFITSKNVCLNLTRNVVHRYKMYYPDDSHREIPLQHEICFQNVPDETVIADPVILPSTSTAAGLQGPDNSHTGYLRASDDQGSSNAATVEGTPAPHIMEREGAGAAGHLSPARSNQDC